MAAPAPAPALRVTARDDRGPVVVHRRGLGLAEVAAASAAARVAGLMECDGGWSAEHPARVVSMLGNLGWDVDADARAADAIEPWWNAAVADAAGKTWDAPGMASVRARGCEPWPHQLEGARRLWASPGGLTLADSPGLGKTLQVLAALPPNAAVNVVCPRNAVPTWVDEVAKWAPHLETEVVKARRTMRPAPRGRVVVGTLESMPALEWADRARVATGAVLVCDEAHSLKGESQQAQRFRTWSDAVRAARGWVWLLTGTPVLNANPEELWRLLDACGRAHDTIGPLDGLRGVFGHTTEQVWVPSRRGKPGAGEFVEQVRWTGEHAAWVDAALARAVVRRTKDVVAKDLPPVVVQDIHVHVSREDLAELLQRDMKVRVDCELSAIERAVAAGADEDEVDRLAAQPAIATARRLLATAKVSATMAVLDDLTEAGEPTLCFSAHVAAVRAVGARDGWGVVDGAVDVERRSAVRRDFQAGVWTEDSAGLASMGGAVVGGRALGVALSIRAASESLTLTRAAHVVFIDLDWVAARNSEQAVGRAHRIGQTRPVTVLRMIADHPVDQRVVSVIDAKARFGRALLAGVENRG